MKICINLCGQPKHYENFLKVLDECMAYREHEYHILYTTWKTENIDGFVSMMKTGNINMKINQIDMPDSNTPHFDTISNSLIYDHSHRITGKHIRNYFYYLYVRQESEKTITNYENEHNIKFDLIITTRPDIKINRPIFRYFETMNEKFVYVPDESRFDVYNEGSVQEALLMGRRDTIVTLLTGAIEILPDCGLGGTNQIHPETSFYKIIKKHDFMVVYLDLNAFIF